MTTTPTRPRIILGLADSPSEPLHPASWIGSFVALGSRLRKFASRVEGRQLVVAISVPRRDYVAALIAAGWTLNAPAPVLGEPIDLFRSAVGGTTRVRAVTDNYVLSGTVAFLDEGRPDPPVHVVRTFPLSRYKAAVELGDEGDACKSSAPPAGYLAELTGAAETWPSRLAAPPADLALVGTAKWLHEDLDALIGNGAEPASPGTPLGAYVLPKHDSAATWSTVVLPASKLGQGTSIPDHCQATILDRFGAIKYLNVVATPIIVCIVDRSVADESAGETVIEARLNNSRPVAVIGELGWRPPKAVEVLAFTVAQ